MWTFSQQLSIKIRVHCGISFVLLLNLYTVHFGICTSFWKRPDLCEPSRPSESEEYQASWTLGFIQFSVNQIHVLVCYLWEEWIWGKIWNVSSRVVLKLIISNFTNFLFCNYLLPNQISYVNAFDNIDRNIHSSFSEVKICPNLAQFPTTLA